MVSVGCGVAALVVPLSITSGTNINRSISACQACICSDIATKTARPISSEGTGVKLTSRVSPHRRISGGACGSSTTITTMLSGTPADATKSIPAKVFNAASRFFFGLSNRLSHRGLATVHPATIRGTATLVGLHLQYKVGDRVEKIRGREISLNRLATTATDKKYPVIRGIALDHQAQKTTVTIQPFQESPAHEPVEFR